MCSNCAQSPTDGSGPAPAKSCLCTSRRTLVATGRPAPGSLTMDTTVTPVRGGRTEPGRPSLSEHSPAPRPGNPRPAAIGTPIPGPGRIGKRGFPVSRFPPFESGIGVPDSRFFFVESGIGDSLPSGFPAKSGIGGTGIGDLGLRPTELATSHWQPLRLLTCAQFGGWKSARLEISIFEDHCDWQRQH